MKLVWKYGEKQVAELVGVDRKMLRHARATRLRAHSDWLVEDGLVTYSESGLVRVLKMLAGMELVGSHTPRVFFGRSLEAIKACCDLNNPLSSGSGTERYLEVVKRYKNRHMMEASLDGAVQRVQVRDNANFSEGLWIPCELIQGNLWRFTGRCPSTPGDGRRKFRFRPGGHDEKGHTSMNEKTEFDARKGPAEPRDGYKKAKKKAKGPAPDQLGAAKGSKKGQK